MVRDNQPGQHHPSFYDHAPGPFVLLRRVAPIRLYGRATLPVALTPGASVNHPGVDAGAPGCRRLRDQWELVICAQPPVKVLADHTVRVTAVTS